MNSNNNPAPQSVNTVVTTARMATLGTNWPVRATHQSEGNIDDIDKIVQHQYFNQHFLANPESASKPQQSNMFSFQSDRGNALGDDGMHSPKSFSTPRFTSNALPKPPPLFSPTPTWHQLRVPAWLDQHDQPLTPGLEPEAVHDRQGQDVARQCEAFSSSNPKNREQRANEAHASQVGLNVVDQPSEARPCWINRQKYPPGATRPQEPRVRLVESKRSAPGPRVVLTEGKRQARAQRIAEARIRNREKKERWKALATKAEESSEDCVMED